MSTVVLNFSGLSEIKSKVFDRFSKYRNNTGNVGANRGIVGVSGVLWTAGEYRWMKTATLKECLLSYLL